MNSSLKALSVILLSSIATPSFAATPNTDFINFQGTLQNQAINLTSPSGISVNRSDQYRVSNISYDGLGGNDFLLMSNESDYLGLGLTHNIENFVAGNSNDFLNLSDQTIDITILLGAGDDVAFGGASNDTVYGSGGNDFIDGGNGDDFLSGGIENDIIYGGAGNDRIEGGSGDNQLFGGAGNDIFLPWGTSSTNHIEGGQGSDIIRLGNGSNTVSGGSERDFFIFETFDGSTSTINDFEGGDFLVISNLLQGFDASNDDINDWVSIVQQGQDAVFSVDIDGLGTNSSLQQLVLLKNINAAQLYAVDSDAIEPVIDPILALFQNVTDPFLNDQTIFVLPTTAVPLPAAGWLFLSALAGLIGRKKFR
jgi:Ca2+-binding RTX toxin-like protein